MYDDDDEPEGPKSSATTYLSEGNVHFNQGEYKKALDSYSQVMSVFLVFWQYRKECVYWNIVCFVNRAFRPWNYNQDTKTALSSDQSAICTLETPTQLSETQRNRWQKTPSILRYKITVQDNFATKKIRHQPFNYLTFILFSIAQ